MFLFPLFNFRLMMIYVNYLDFREKKEIERAHSEHGQLFQMLYANY